MDPANVAASHAAQLARQSAIVRHETISVLFFILFFFLVTRFILQPRSPFSLGYTSIPLTYIFVNTVSPILGSVLGEFAERRFYYRLFYSPWCPETIGLKPIYPILTFLTSGAGVVWIVVAMRQVVREERLFGQVKIGNKVWTALGDKQNDDHPDMNVVGQYKQVSMTAQNEQEDDPNMMEMGKVGRNSDHDLESAFARSPLSSPPGSLSPTAGRSRTPSPPLPLAVTIEVPREHVKTRTMELLYLIYAICLGGIAFWNYGRFPDVNTFWAAVVGFYLLKRWRSKVEYPQRKRAMWLETGVLVFSMCDYAFFNTDQWAVELFCFGAGLGK